MRSLLFVPAHDTRKLTKGLDCGADALIIDLKDAATDPYRIARTSTLLDATAATVPGADVVHTNFRAAQRLRLRRRAGALHHS